MDWDRDGVRDLLVGAEDGRFYYQKQKRVDPMRIESFLIEGRGFEVATLDNGQSAYGNREYIWFDVPDELRGGQVTRTSGGVRAVIRVTCAETTMLRMATAAVQKGVSLEGWKKVEGMGFGYPDQRRTWMAVFERDVKAGETLEILQGNWAGGLVLLPRAK